MASNDPLRTRGLWARTPLEAFPVNRQGKGLNYWRIQAPFEKAKAWWRWWNDVNLSLTLTIDPVVSVSGASSYTLTWPLARGEGTLTERDLLFPGLTDDVLNPIARVRPSVFR